MLSSTKCFVRKMATYNVMVYGTLKTNEPNYYLLTDAKNGKAQLVGKATTVNKFPLVIASKFNIPFLLNKPGFGNNIHGEVYNVDESMLKVLDELENHPDYYTREEQPVTLDSNGETIKAWIYILGNYRDELLQKPMLSNYSSKGEHGLEYIPSDDIADPNDIYQL